MIDFLTMFEEVRIESEENLDKEMLEWLNVPRTLRETNIHFFYRIDESGVRGVINRLRNKGLVEFVAGDEEAYRSVSV